MLAGEWGQEREQGNYSGPSPVPMPLSHGWSCLRPERPSGAGGSTGRADANDVRFLEGKKAKRQKEGWQKEGASSPSFCHHHSRQFLASWRLSPSAFLRTDRPAYSFCRRSAAGWAFRINAEGKRRRGADILKVEPSCSGERAGRVRIPVERPRRRVPEQRRSTGRADANDVRFLEGKPRRLHRPGLVLGSWVVQANHQQLRDAR